MAKKKKRKHGIKPDLPIIIDYGGDLVSVYDPVSVMPYSEPPITERTRYKKLNAEQKAAFKSMFVSAVTSYWNENRLIPFGEDMADIRKWMLEAFAEEYGILMKEDSELKNYLMTLVISVEKLSDDPCHFHPQQAAQSRKEDTRKGKSVTRS